MKANNKEMREALESVRRDMWDLMGSSSESLCEALALRINKTIRAALSAPPRNCDAFSKAEVLKVLEDRSFSKEDTIEWLYSTAEERKGGNNGRK